MAGLGNKTLKSDLDDGVKLRIVDPSFRTITVCRGDVEPGLFNATQGMSAVPQVPGFNVAVADVFSR